MKPSIFDIGLPLSQASESVDEPKPAKLPKFFPQNEKTFVNNNHHEYKLGDEYEPSSASTFTDLYSKTKSIMPSSITNKRTTLALLSNDKLITKSKLLKS